MRHHHPQRGPGAGVRLKRQWPSPNGTIRGIMDGTVFLPPDHPGQRPGQGEGLESRSPSPAAYLGTSTATRRWWCRPRGRWSCCTPPRRRQAVRLLVNDFQGGGVAMGMFNTDAPSAPSPAPASPTPWERINLWFGTKDTISKKYHARFRELFQDGRTPPGGAGGGDHYLLPDRRRRGPDPEERGGYLWACMNYDSDVMSDMVAEGFRAWA